MSAYGGVHRTYLLLSELYQVVWVIVAESVAQAMNLAMQNATFRDVMTSAGLPIDASAVVRTDALPGPSVLQQAAEMGYPSTVYPTPHISSPHTFSSPDRELIGVLCGSIAVSFLLLGAHSHRPVHDRLGPSQFCVTPIGQCAGLLLGGCYYYRARYSLDAPSAYPSLLSHSQSPLLVCDV